METLTAVLQELREGHMRVEEGSWVENLGIPALGEQIRDEGIQFYSDQSVKVEGQLRANQGQLNPEGGVDV